MSKNNIPFKNISGLTVEQRLFIGEGMISTRQALVIAYSEDSGYKDEMVLTFNNDLHHYLWKKLGYVYECQYHNGNT